MAFAQTVAVLLLAQVSTGEGAQAGYESLPSPLREAASWASGIAFCAPDLKRSQGAAFHARFGARVERLAAKIREDSETDRPASIPYHPVCAKTIPSDLAIYANEFAQTLQELEDLHGLGDAPEDSVVCHVIEAPNRYEGKRVRIRGAVRYGRSGPSLVDGECGDLPLRKTGWGTKVNLSEMNDFRPGFIRFVTFTGRIRNLACTSMRPSGTRCGPFLIAESADAIVTANLCWEYKALSPDLGYRVVLAPCKSTVTAPSE